RLLGYRPPSLIVSLSIIKLTLCILPNLPHLRGFQFSGFPVLMGGVSIHFSKFREIVSSPGRSHNRHHPSSLQRDAVVVSHLIVSCERPYSAVCAEELLRSPHLDGHEVSVLYYLLLIPTGIRYDEPASDLANSSHAPQTPLH